MALIMSDKVAEALAEAGVLSDVRTVRRVVIDLQPGNPPVIHIERWGDERLLALVQSLDGVEIRYEPAPEVAG